MAWPFVISSVGWSRPMLRMANLAGRCADAFEGDHVFVQVGVAVAAGPLDGVVFPCAGGQGGQAGELGLAALAQGEPGDAAAAELLQDLVGGELGVEDQQAGIFSGRVAPVVGEGDDLGGLLGLGDVGVGVDHLVGGVVVGEEGEHRAGALGSRWHVVLFQDRVVAVVADRVEVKVEAVRAGGQAEGAQAADESGEQGHAGFTVAVGGQVGGLGQRGEAEEERQPFVVGDLVDVVGTGDAGRRGQQQGGDGVPG